MNKKITFVATDINGNMGTDDIVTDDLTDMGDALANYGVAFHCDGDTYYVIDENEERTGEAFQVISIVDTDEYPHGFGD